MAIDEADLASEASDGLVTDGEPADDSELTMSDMVIADLVADLGADLGGGWSGSAYERMTAAEGTTPASMDRVVIYNNKGDDESVGFEAYYTGLVPTRSFNGANGAIVVALATDTVTLEDVSTDTTVDNADGVMGTFHGLAGTFTCDGAAECVISVLADGSYRNTGTGILTFTPTLPEGTEDAEDKVDDLMVTVDDQDYMHFGFWWNVTDEDEPTAEVNGFFGGTMPSTEAIIMDRATDMDSAKYAGPASGLYVLKTFDTHGTSTYAESGQFTAMASLTAYFGADPDVASSKHNKVEGTISGFMANGEAIPGGWSLTLMAAQIAADTATFSGTTQETDNDDGDMVGAWRGGFFGGMADDNATDVDEGANPSGVAGEFTGHFSNGHVLGGFGAEMDDDS